MAPIVNQSIQENNKKRKFKMAIKALAHYKDLHNDFPKKVVVKIVADI